MTFAHRSRSLRTPANMFIINLAVADLLMCVTQTPIFFTTSMNKRWIFGEKGNPRSRSRSRGQTPPLTTLTSAGCELYAFCGALFGICSMITLTVIAIDRYFVITRPLTSIGVLSRKRAFIVLSTVWIYSLGWSLPPFFGWSEDTHTRSHSVTHTRSPDPVAAVPYLTTLNSMYQRGRCFSQ